MKQKLSFLMLVVLSISLVIVSVPELQVQAGEMSKTISFRDENGQLNSTDWYDPNDSLEVVDGNLIIPNDSTADTRIISKTIATSDELREVVADVSCQLQFTKLPKGKKFVIALGLSNIEAYSGDAANIEVELFQEKNALMADIVAYEQANEATVVAETKKIGSSVKAKLDVRVLLKSNREISVSVNGTKVLSGTTPVSGDGRVGLLQTGNCGAKVSELTVGVTQYERPENPEFIETFEEGLYNKNLFVMKFAEGTIKPSYMVVEEYKGSNVLMYRNTGLSYLGTKYMYSNFELTFDVPFLLREEIKDEDGKIIATPSGFGVSIGDETLDINKLWGYTDSVEFLFFSTNAVLSHNHTPAKFNTEYSKMGFYDESTNEGFSVRIEMVDGHLTLGMKALEAEKFRTVAEADYENFRTGYIKFWTTVDGNVAIDNIQIKNLDKKPNTIEVPFESAVLEGSDYEYVEPEDVFVEEGKAENKAEKHSDVKSMILICTLIGCVTILFVGVLVRFILVQKRKGRVKENETL